jgi:5-methylcytosine-specific restriction endonuclease McrA
MEGHRIGSAASSRKANECSTVLHAMTVTVKQAHNPPASHNIFTCEQCGMQAHRRMGGNSTRNRFCSMQCRKDSASIERSLRKLQQAQEAEERRRLKAIDRLARLEAKAAIASLPKPDRLCSCGNVMGPRVRMCRQCREVLEAQYRQQYRKAYRKTEIAKAHKKAYKTKRRAKESATIHNVKPTHVFERDKWRCQLCGGKAPKALRGTNEDSAPTIDHIISLTEGGDHTYANLQCACRKCNMLKGSKSRGQLGLSLH